MFEYKTRINSEKSQWRQYTPVKRLKLSLFHAIISEKSDSSHNQAHQQHVKNWLEKTIFLSKLHFDLSFRTKKIFHKNILSVARNLSFRETVFSKVNEILMKYFPHHFWKFLWACIFVLRKDFGKPLELECIGLECATYATHDHRKLAYIGAVNQWIWWVFVCSKIMIWRGSLISFSDSRGQYPTSDTSFERYWSILHPP